MKQFLIDESNRDVIISWCTERMVQRDDYQWFPGYCTYNTGNPAFRLDIHKDHDAASFILANGDRIVCEFKDRWLKV